MAAPAPSAVRGSPAGPAGNWPITLCPADDWSKGVSGRRLGPLQARALGCISRLLCLCVCTCVVVRVWRMVCCRVARDEGGCTCGLVLDCSAAWFAVGGQRLDGVMQALLCLLFCLL